MPNTNSFTMYLLIIQIHLSAPVLTVLLTIIVAVTVWAIVSMSRKKKNGVKHKVEAEAIILSVTRTGLYINDQPRLKLHMQVQPEKGRNFVAELQEVFPASMLNSIHAGLKLVVSFDPANQKDVVIVNFIS